MKKKEVVSKTEPKEQTGFSGDIVLGFTKCLHCGKPSEIISPKGNPFCCLSCQTNHE